MITNIKLIGTKYLPKARSQELRFIKIKFLTRYHQQGEVTFGRVLYTIILNFLPVFSYLKARFACIFLLYSIPIKFGLNMWPSVDFLTKT